MRRILFFTLSLLVISAALTACGTAGGPDKPAPTEPPVQAAEPEPTGEPASGVYAEPLTVLDNDSCAITVTGVHAPEYEGDAFYVDVELVNKTDGELTFQPDDPGCAVNGIMAGVGMSGAVPAGETVDTYIAVYEALGWGQDVDYGIETWGYTDIALHLAVQDEDYNEVGAAYFHLYPQGEENAVHIPFEVEPDYDLMFENEYVTAYFLGYTYVDDPEDPDNGYMLSFGFVNNSDVPLRLRFRTDNALYSVYLNDTVGGEITFWAERLLPGTWCFGDSVQIRLDALSKYELESLTSISGTMQFSDPNDTSIVYGTAEFRYEFR